MNVLQIIHTAYRATTEEQDDTIVWLTHAMKGAGGDLTVLLQGNAVNYAVANQQSAALSFGDWKQTQPANLPRDIAALIDKDVPVFVAAEDCVDRGIGDDVLIDGVEKISRSDLPGFVERFDQLWRW